MREVRASKFTEVKSVFNSGDDNLHFYKVLKNSFGAQFINVELAQPTIQHTAGLIIWKAETTGNFQVFDDLSAELKDTVAQEIKEAFEDFKQKIKPFKNFPEGFDSKFMEIPSSASILVSDEFNNRKIVITDWGFLDDSLNPRTGVLQSIFPAAEYSILAQLISTGKQGIPEKLIRLSSGGNTVSDTTDSQGCARLGSVKRGQSFSLSSGDNSFPDTSFVSDGREKFLIEIAKYVRLKFRVKNSSLVPISHQSFGFYTERVGKIDSISDQNGEFEILHEQNNSSYLVYDWQGNEIHSGLVPASDDTVDIILDDDSEPILPLETDSDLSYSSNSVLLHFVNFFGRPIKGIPVSVNGTGEGTSALITDETGTISVSNLSIDDKNSINFDRRGERWNHTFIHSSDIDEHTFSVRPIYPWLWWLLIGLLSWLLIMCLLGYCCCDRFGQSDTHRGQESHLYEGDNDIDQRRSIEGGQNGEVTVTLVWETVDDMDLVVIEPSGEKIFFENAVSNSGGRLDIDRNRAALTAMPIENIYWPERSAPRGRYEVQVLFYKRNQNAVISVPVLIQVDIAGRKQMFKEFLTTEQNSVVITEFEY